MSVTYIGLSYSQLQEVLSSCRDHIGNRIEPFVDRDGGWPLRCCLSDSQPGDRLAIIAFSPFPWTSPYRETGPVVVHADGCQGANGRFPEQFEARDQVLRAFGSEAGRTRTQVYDRHRLVRAGDGLQRAIEDVLGDDRIEFVHVHNVLSQCYSFAAARALPG
jgi:hypothetical protein